MTECPANSLTPGQASFTSLSLSLALAASLFLSLALSLSFREFSRHFYPKGLTISTLNKHNKYSTLTLSLDLSFSLSFSVSPSLSLVLSLSFAAFVELSVVLFCLLAFKCKETMIISWV